MVGFHKARLAIIVGLLTLLCSRPGTGQDLSLFDPRPFGGTGRPLGLAGSAFEVWVAYPGALLQFRRMGNDAPKWFGIAQGIPLEGIASICYDDPTQSLWIRSLSGKWLRWSTSFGSAREESPPVGGCNTKLARDLDLNTLAHLTPSPPGWLRMGSDFLDPQGNRTHIRQAILLDDRELWITTDGGIWSGRAVSGRVDPRPAGLAENCIARITLDSSGALWMQGCQGSFTALVDQVPQATFLPSEPRYYELRSPRMLGPSGTRGVWVSVFDGLVRLTTDGLSERLLGRKAPFGGRALSTLERGDTLWCGTQRSLSYRVRSKSFVSDVPPWEAPGAVTALLGTPLGVLAATPDGLWLRSAAGWTRPTWLSRTASRPIEKATMERQPPHRVAWWDGREIHIDTLPGFGGQPDRWIPGGSALRSMAFDDQGRLHLALDGSWVVWNPASGEQRAWKAGLGLSGDIHDCLPKGDRILLGGQGGATSVRIPSYAPPSSMSR
jgi:hypothetical protein